MKKKNIQKALFAKIWQLIVGILFLIVQSISAVAGVDGSLCAASSEDAFFTANFKCGRAMEIAYEQNIRALSGHSRAEILAYAKAFDAGMQGQMALFLMSPELLVARDPKFSFKIMKAMLNKRAAEDAFGEIEDTIEIIIGAPSLPTTMENLGNSPILWASKLGQHDAEMLMVLSQQDAETAVAIYKGFVAVVGALQ